MQDVPLPRNPAHHADMAQMPTANEKHRTPINGVINAYGVIVAQRHDLPGLLAVSRSVALRQADLDAEHLPPDTLGQRRAVPRFADIGLANVLITPMAHSSVHKKTARRRLLNRILLTTTPAKSWGRT